MHARCWPWRATEGALGDVGLPPFSLPSALSRRKTFPFGGGGGEALGGHGLQAQGSWGMPSTSNGIFKHQQARTPASLVIRFTKQRGQLGHRGQTERDPRSTRGKNQQPRTKS